MHITHNNNDLLMQRLTTAAPIHEATLTTYEETVGIIHRHLPPSLALLYATARRNAEGRLEWWTARQGLAKPFSALNDAERLTVENKRQQYQDILAGLISQLAARGEDKSAHALQTLLTQSHHLDGYSVGGEPVLVNWATASTAAPLHTVVVIPWCRGFLPWLALLLLLLLLVGVWWWFTHRPAVTLPVVTPTHTELTDTNPSVKLEKRQDFGRIKINLQWKQGDHKEPVDLDIAAFVRLKNGEISGAEALSHLPGNYDQPPYLLLQEDLREGNDVDGEWLFVNGSHWQDIDEVLIYSFIYAGKGQTPPSPSMSPNSSRLHPCSRIATSVIMSPPSPGSKMSMAIFRLNALTVSSPTASRWISTMAGVSNGRPARPKISLHHCGFSQITAFKG